MSLKVLIGAALAASLASSAAEVYKEVKSSISENANLVSNMDSQPNPQLQPPQLQPQMQQSTTEYEFERAKEGFCEYCGGIIPLDRGYLRCPHCGHAITQKVVRQVVVRQKTSTESLGRPVYAKPQAPVYTPGAYYCMCYNCNSTLRYTAKDIYRRPGANKAVKAKGFQGHTGEVRCPRCGVYLPHYEANWK